MTEGWLRRMRASGALVFLFALATASVARADVALAKLFTDGAVLQRGRPLPVWGSADAGEKVTVEFAGGRVETTAAANGHWRVTLAALPATFEPRTLTVRGRNTVTVANIVVGEVWFCSGQSNMEKPLGPRRGQRPTTDHDLEIASANHPGLRLFQVPRTDLKQDGEGLFRWLPCSPEALQKSDFSAAAYFFGRQLQLTLGVPVGLIHASFGGTRIEAWLPPEAFTGPLAGLDQEKYQAWVPGVQPTELFASMVRPFAPYAVRGFLWYQGEANCMVPDIEAYTLKQGALIEQWRRAWEIEDAPFYAALLAPFDYSKWKQFPVTDLALPAFWQAQVGALSAPGTGYIVTTDLVDDLHDIHPVNKRDVGLRFARLALAETYGRTDIAARGPTVASANAAGSTFVLTFEHAQGLRTRDGRAVSDFVIAGSDRNFHPAVAKIDGGKVILSSEAVPSPLAARFAWHETATPNLINAAGLPAVPFRTDDWPVTVKK
jgi:sialate O-acetylesterase